MKLNYKIGEIASIYEISTDTLRHYEKEGLLIPNRSNNGYREYSIFDIWKLNIIQTMKSLGVQLKDIKYFLENRSIDKEIELLLDEKKYIEKKIKSLENQNMHIKNRLNSLKTAKNIKNFCEVEIKYIEDRKVIYVEKDISTDNQVDLAYSHLSNIEKNSIHFFNRDFGVISTIENIKNKNFNSYNKAFLVISNDDAIYDDIIEGGKYAIIKFSGPYSNSSRAYKILFEKLNELKLNTANFVIERFIVDINQTSNEDEYITEIQVRIEF